MLREAEFADKAATEVMITYTRLPAHAPPAAVRSAAAARPPTQARSSPRWLWAIVFLLIPALVVTAGAFHAPASVSVAEVTVPLTQVAKTTERTEPVPSLSSRAPVPQAQAEAPLQPPVAAAPTVGDPAADAASPLSGAAEDAADVAAPALAAPERPAPTAPITAPRPRIASTPPVAAVPPLVPPRAPQVAASARPARSASIERTEAAAARAGDKEREVMRIVAWLARKGQ